MACLYMCLNSILKFMADKSPQLVLLGKKIRMLRESNDYSQDTFAHEVGLGRSYYGRLERGQINPSVLTLIKISQALKVKLADLIPEQL